MPVCANSGGGGRNYVVAEPTRTDFQNCEIVLSKGSEYSGWQELGNLSIDDASVIGMHVALVWAIAWTFRVLAKSLSSESAPNE